MSEEIKVDEVLHEVECADGKCEEGCCSSPVEVDADIPECDSDICDAEDCEHCPKLGEVSPPEAGHPVDPTLEFDLMRPARQEALSNVRDVLERIQKGAKLSRKDIVKSIKNLMYHAVFLDELTVSLLQEMYQMAQKVAQQEVSEFSLGANIKTIVVALDKKGVITQAELNDIFSKEVLPQELARFTGKSEEPEAEVVAPEEPVAIVEEVKPPEG